MSDRRPHEPRKQPRQERSRALVDAILAATEQVLAADGADGLTTTRVAEVAGVSVGSLYQYFPSKESLIAAVIERRIEDDLRWLAQVDAELAAQPEPEPLRVLVRRGIERSVALFRAETALYREIVASMHTVARDDLVAAMVADGIRRVAAVLARQGMTAEDAERAAWIAVTAQVAVLRTAARERPALLDDPRLIDDLEGMCMRLFAPGEPG
jgi:AcrR family transcriptional regulator